MEIKPPFSPKHPVLCGILQMSEGVLHKSDIAHFHSFPDLSQKNEQAAAETAFVSRLLLSLQQVVTSEWQDPLMCLQLQANVLTYLTRLTKTFYMF